MEGEQEEVKIRNQKLVVTKTSLNCMGLNNKFRLETLKLVEHKMFDNFILLCIVSNSITLALFDYSDREAKDVKN